MYAKVFAQMYDGSLCTQGPWEALVTFQQFLVLADQDGVVDMTAEAISRRTTVPLEIIKKGIKTLVLPDPQSRTPTEDGRRLVPLSEGRSWGWAVVNYKHYRQLKREEDRRDYHREYWHKRKATQQTQQTQPNQPIAEAKAEAVKSSAGKPAGDDPPGFLEFWATWPKSDRKQDRKKCAAKWKREGFHSKAGEIISHVEAMKSSKQWREGFEPAPLTYLNGERWADGQSQQTSAFEGCI
jgi:hypothetical protein